ncbi:PAS domain S-box protein [Caulobacter sp. FWC2]|uniref:PAS domain-containing hybrid sensor histidine kinase/response regulator n=1 Tax=Caulobacter sp. FWC2 TaxID=69664 RepID=UPI001303F8BC|nr:PAS domain S-box protein [Caulobacter sp. FWC2]
MTEPNDRRFELLVESLTGYGVYMLDLAGKVTSWNRGAQNLKGYSAEEIQGQPFSRFFTPEDRRAGLPEHLIDQARKDGRVDGEGWRVRKDGSQFWAVATLHLMRDDHGEPIGFAKVTRDMTEQRAAQQALIESERRFRYLVEGVVDYAIYMLDVNGVVTNWNRGAQRIKGYDAEEIVGRHFGAFYTPEDRSAGRPALALATAKAEGRFEGEGWRLRKDASRFWASVVIDPIHDEAGTHIGYAKITRDISERKAAEEALAQSERQFRMLVEGVVDYALYMLDPNGIITNWNAGAQKIKGYQASEIVGQHFSKFYAPEDRAAGLPLQGLHQAASEGRFEAEAWRVRKDGTRFWANVVIDPIRDETGHLVGYAKITRDITDKKRAQAELDQARERIAHNQKMEALGQLTGGVAHDFNNLLMVVGGQAHLLRAKVGDDAKAHRALDAIETSALRGQDLTRHLLSFARRQRLQTTVAPFAERMSGVRELVATSLPASIELELIIPETLWSVEVDQGELDLAILNLAVNARDAMPAGGRLTISARNTSLPPSAGGLEGDFVEVCVADTGTGIAPDILERIFEPFFTTKDIDKGTGLGLSHVYGFAQQAGGDVQVHSALGAGTRFSILLPRSRETATPKVQASAASGQIAAAKVLLVEDNPDVADVATGLLESLGHQVWVAIDAATALSAMQKEPLPDLVISDIVMAGEMDGVGLARLLRERHPDLPILLATGYSQSAEHLASEFRILRKPYSLDDLRDAIQMTMTQASAISQGTVIPLARSRGGRERSA